MADTDEMCPICRSRTYLNPNMRFLINSECYHKICESCVDRIFSRGPAPCPYRDCGKILRRQRFKTQVFEDLNVEREVDVRQRITKVYNRPESSFASEREYNDYLEQIESLIFEISGPDGPEKEAAKAEVRDYEKTHKQEILENALKQRQQQQFEVELTAKEAERERRLRLLAIELSNQENEYRRIMQHETLTSLAEGRDAEVVLKEAADRAKQRTDLLRRQYEMELERSRVASAAARSLPSQQLSETAATPFTPFAGDRTPSNLFKQLPEYSDPLMASVITDPTLRAGGFTAQFSERGALMLAFMGLDVDVEMEKAETGSHNGPPDGSQHGVMAAVDV